LPPDLRPAFTGTSQLVYDQARAKPSSNGLSLRGFVKHLVYPERNWSDRIEAVPPGEGAFEVYLESFSLSESERLCTVLHQYEQPPRNRWVTGGIDHLGRRVPVPAEPWFPDPEARTVRWILVHLIEETARHAGHADIIREALDVALSGPLMEATEGWPEDGRVKACRARKLISQHDHPPTPSRRPPAGVLRLLIPGV
jgi:uncharacterized damage-inducible protein DinB